MHGALRRKNWRLVSAPKNVQPETQQLERNKMGREKGKSAAIIKSVQFYSQGASKVSKAAWKRCLEMVKEVRVGILYVLWQSYVIPSIGGNSSTCLRGSIVEDKLWIPQLQSDADSHVG